MSYGWKHERKDQVQVTVLLLNLLTFQESGDEYTPSKKNSGKRKSFMEESDSEEESTLSRYAQNCHSLWKSPFTLDIGLDENSWGFLRAQC